MLEKRSDYEKALLLLMRDLPGCQGHAREIEQHFFENFYDQIPKEDFLELERGVERWRKEVQFSRFQLVKKGLMDDPQRGVWRLTDAGKRWLADPSSIALQPKPMKESAGKRKPRQRAEKAGRGAKSSVYSILDRELKTIRSYLVGSSSLQPDGEKLCDWVHFCYTLELYAEGRDLFALVNPAEVHPWYFERTKRIARLCEFKAR